MKSSLSKDFEKGSEGFEGFGASTQAQQINQKQGTPTTNLKAASSFISASRPMPPQVPQSISIVPKQAVNPTNGGSTQKPETQTVSISITLVEKDHKNGEEVKLDNVKINDAIKK